MSNRASVSRADITLVRPLLLLPKALAWVTAVFTVASGLQYIVMGLKQLEAHASVDERV